MEALPTEPKTWTALPHALRESWLRSAGGVRDPISALPPIELDDVQLREYRQHHPLRLVLPVLKRLLIEPATEAGLIVAIGDAAGRLLWVEGARETLRQAERSAFQPGANWSETAIGTSAPGLALATGRGAQVHREQHFSYTAHRFSCSAVPVRDPATGLMLGVVDLTGDAQAVAVHSLPLLLAAVSAAEAELKLRPAATTQATLTTLGAGPAVLGTSDAQQQLGLRHAEILFLLGWQADRGAERGLTAEELAELLYGEAHHEVAVRAELVRLRRLLAQHRSPSIDLLSRPYRLSAPVQLDARDACAALTAGDRQRALDLYRGELLPGSEAPGVLRIRRELSALLREAVLSDGSAEDLWRYLQLPEAAEDSDAIRTALRMMPPESPRRAALVARSTL
ncbi:transcriptional regulator [Nesterenkonia sp. LB17]|uniref:transcriptional regulator n=1 Tax=unclassified Nesterenkonia TaxID=2629769 RepID=UPI001F4C95F1|nr:MULTISPECIES: transcriptional regulator [unclassified Nesterenkonia]MCH8561364.1 transcriptional regulator [Nesterenkonia sp. DZ6]MCH8565240.1 transcriptional regulator [Nesterenkonia sp. LB17]MCH8571176.1 transcriptional regulator [Nesterenkonia sp. AY15]